MNCSSPPLPTMKLHLLIKSSAPIRVLQVVGRMNPGGVETWLLHVLQHIDRDRFQIDFWVHSDQEGLYDAEIRELGSRIRVAPPLKTPWAYAAALRKILKQSEPYPVIHSHVHYFSGAVLRIAANAGVPVRIAHSHLDTSKLDSHPTLKRQFYLELTRRWIDHYATVGLSASGLAATSLFGKTWQNDPRWQILHCGVNLKPFHTDAQIDQTAQIRASFQIPANAFVLGHVGRFEPQKNHAFLVQLAAEVLKHQPNTYLFLVGQGSRLTEIQNQAEALGIRDRVIFAGIRRDVPQLMQGVMDVFVLPSWQEGLPLVLMEAQAAGLPCIISDTITSEVDIVLDLIHRCSLSASVDEWVKQILAVSIASRNRIQQRALEQVENSTFNIDSSVQTLESLYLENAQYAI